MGPIILDPGAIRPLLNPVVSSYGFLFRGWFWVGSLEFMAVPLLGILKIICDHVEPPVTRNHRPKLVRLFSLKMRH
jgi:hypothetical protein